MTFETAVRLYPMNPTARSTPPSPRSDVAIRISAARYLGKVNAKMRIPEYDNAKGVLEMLRGEYDRAESYLASWPQMQASRPPHGTSKNSPANEKISSCSANKKTN